MTHRIFFSWQSDIANRVGRSSIEAFLGRAIGELQADADPAECEVAVDRDRLDVPGMPPIMETIFGKIDRSAVFMSDLTYVVRAIFYPARAISVILAMPLLRSKRWRFGP